MAYPFPEIKRVEEVFSTLKADAALLEEAKRRGFYTLTHDEIKAHSHVLPQDLWRRYHESYLNFMSIGRHEYLTKYHKKHGC